METRTYNTIVTIKSVLKEFKGMRFYELKNGRKIIAKIYFPNEFHPSTYNIEYPFGFGAEYKDLESLVKGLNKYLDGCYFGNYDLIGDLTKDESCDTNLSKSISTSESVGIVEYPENSAALLGNTKLKKIKDLKTPTESSGLIEAGQKEDTTKEGYLITFKTNPLKGSEVYKGVVEYKEQLGLAVCVNGMKCESRKALDIKKTYNTPLIIDDFAKYDYFDYPTTPEELDGFKLGEVVYDQCGEIGVILAFNEKNGTARLNSNGCCDVGNLKKCPTEIAEREVKHMDIIRPEKSLPSYATAKYYDKKVI